MISKDSTTAARRPTAEDGPHPSAIAVAEGLQLLRTFHAVGCPKARARILSFARTEADAMRRQD